MKGPDPIKKPVGNYIRPLKRRQKNPKLPSSQKTAMALILAVGVLMGYSANRMVEQLFGEITFNIAKVAAQAHAIYAKQAARTVELNAIDQKQIEAWFSKALKPNFKIPNLQSFGLEFIGARLTVAADQPATYLLYINDNDQQLAYFITKSKSANDGDTTSQETKKYNQVTWHKAKFGHVLLSKLPLENLNIIAKSIQSN